MAQGCWARCDLDASGGVLMGRFKGARDEGLVTGSQQLEGFSRCRSLRLV